MSSMSNLYGSKPYFSPSPSESKFTESNTTKRISSQWFTFTPYGLAKGCKHSGPISDSPTNSASQGSKSSPIAVRVLQEGPKNPERNKIIKITERSPQKVTELAFTQSKKRKTPTSPFSPSTSCSPSPIETGKNNEIPLSEQAIFCQIQFDKKCKTATCSSPKHISIELEEKKMTGVERIETIFRKKSVTTFRKLPHFRPFQKISLSENEKKRLKILTFKSALTPPLEGSQESSSQEKGSASLTFSEIPKKPPLLKRANACDNIFFQKILAPNDPTPPLSSPIDSD